MNFGNIILRKRKEPDTEPTTAEPISVNCPEETPPWRWKVDEWLPGMGRVVAAGGRGTGFHLRLKCSKIDYLVMVK